MDKNNWAKVIFMGSKTLTNFLNKTQPAAIPFTLASILPNVSQTLDGTGFIFGAGASYEAGYPMMPKLTRDVIASLNGTERSILDEALSSAGISYDNDNTIPNIEELADLVIAHHINSDQPRFKDLENKLRQLTLEIILSVESPDLSNHITFFEKLKARAFGRPCSVWIWTTNYDLLLETAASIAGVQVENGFTGTTERYFTPDIFQKVSGTLGSRLIGGSRFTPNNQLVIKLFKLHGSISWIKQGTHIFERHPLAISADAQRVLVMPRRRKVMDTLVCPYDSLFSISRRVLGSQCKYLASCGFSFSDDHINQNLFFPIINDAKCHLSVLSDCEPTALSSIVCLRNYNGGYQSGLRIKGQETEGTTDLWKFSEFVKLF
jgi:hypothetical protein